MMWRCSITVYILAYSHHYIIVTNQASNTSSINLFRNKLVQRMLAPCGVVGAVVEARHGIHER